MLLINSNFFARTTGWAWTFFVLIAVGLVSGGGFLLHKRGMLPVRRRPRLDLPRVSMVNIIHHENPDY